MLLNKSRFATVSHTKKKTPALSANENTENGTNIIIIPGVCLYRTLLRQRPLLRDAPGWE